MESRTDILIIGAGLTGLSAACQVRKKCRLRVIERQAGPGGLAVTDEEQGFRFDKTGHLLHLRHPAVRRWILRLMGERLTVVRRLSRIWSHGVYTRYPFQSNTFGLPPQVAKECLMGYLKVRETPPRIRIKSFLDFIHVHFGKGFAKHFMVPYNKKIWGVHPRAMTAAWCERFVPVPALEDVIDGAVGLHDRELGYNVDFHYPSHGIALLANRLAGAVQKDVEIDYGRSVLSVDYRKRRARLEGGETIQYDSLISTMPLKALGGRLDSPPRKVKTAVGLLRCNPLRYLNVALKKPAGTPYHWCYVPQEKIPFYRVGAYSNFSKHLVPPGRGSLYVELASRGPVNMRSVMPEVIKYLVEMKIIARASDILFAKPRLLDYAYVVYDHNYPKVVPLLHRFLEKEGIFSTGRYGSWNYSAMEDALVMGKETAERVLSF